MEKYKEYKDSGIEWLGDIPEEWEVLKAKQLCSKIGDGLHGTPSYDKNGAFKFINGNNLNDGVLNLKNARRISKIEYLKIRKRINNNTIFYSINGTIGNIAFYNNESIALGKSVAYLNLKLSSNKYYYRYFLMSNVVFDFFNLEQTGTTINNLSLNTLNNTFYLIPPIKEQAQIANYLDAKTTAIDKKIKLLQQKIKHYKAYRKTLINETVTKGLKNDNSNWVNYRLKDIGYLYSGLSGKSGNDFNQDDNPNNKGFIPFTNIANNTYLDENHLGTVVIAEKEKQNQVKKNDIFFLMSSEGYEDIGKSAVLIDDIKETYLNSFCKGFRITNKNCEASFINYLLLSDSYRQEMLVEGKGFTRINLKMEKVNNFSIAIPSTKKEQQQIVDYLDGKTTIIDKITKNIETQITTLKELRKTLINEVVTGKVKVSA